MASTYEISKAAEEDIDALLDDSIARFGVDQTERYFESLVNCLSLISGNPEMGVTVDQIRRGYRYFSHESHVIFYQQIDVGIFIVRILHKRMDALSILK